MTYEPREYWPERYARQGATYVARGGRPRDWHEEKAWIEPLFAHLPDSGIVLDFGCGPGRFRSALEASREYVGVDLIPGLGTEPLDTALTEGRFDCAVAVMVLQHIVDDDAYADIVDRLNRALKPGGKLLVVDHDVIEKPREHMRPRGPGRAILAGRWSYAEIVAGIPKHWAGVFTR